MLITEPTTCVHRWVIEAGGNGPLSWGECQVCNERKTFQNYIPYQGWGEIRSTNGEDTNHEQH